MELIIQIAGTQLHKRCNFEGNSCTGGVIPVWNPVFHAISSKTLYSVLVYN